MENLYQKMNSKLYQRHKTDNILQKPNKLQLQYHRARFNSHDLQKRKKHKLINIYNLKNLTIDQSNFNKSETSDLFQLSKIKTQSMEYKKPNSVEPKIDTEQSKQKLIFIPKVKPNKNYFKSLSRK